MSRARIVLHAGALVVACLTVYVTARVMFGQVGDVAGLWPFAAAAALSAQVAVLFGWRVLNRYIREPWTSAVFAGLLAAFVTHLLFGPMLAVVSWAGGLGPVETNLGGWFGLSFYSALFLGWATAPPAMLGAAWAGSLRRKELARAGA